MGEIYGGIYWSASMKTMSKLHKGALIDTYFLVEVMNCFVSVLQPVTSHFLVFNSWVNWAYEILPCSHEGCM